MDGDETRVEITDWEGITTEIERFCADGQLHAESDLVSCTVGSATIEIRANGRVEGSMPLHGFVGIVETLAFDHVEGTITAESEQFSYEFRRP